MMTSVLLAVLTALLAIVVGNPVIDYLKRWKIGQAIRTEGPQSHHAKAGTPTMGGWIIIVPAMIYFLRMPTNVVLGTSLVQIIGVTIVTTILQATSNYAVDIVLAFFLVIGGVVGAQLGVRAGARLRGEQLRFLLAVVVLAVAFRLAWGLVANPADIYSTMLGS